MTPLPPPDARVAFEAGWIAAFIYIEHEWGPSPPCTVDEAWQRWLEQRENPYLQDRPEAER